MDAWTWDDHWTLEVAELDGQHADVMLQWNRVREAEGAGRTEPWRGLLAEMRRHFDFEDAWMDGSGFAHRSHHKRDHRVFLAEMQAVMEDAEAGFPVEDDVVQAVRGWLNGHVKGLDRDFARFVLDRDVWDLKAEWELEEFDRRSSLVQG